LTSSSVPTVLTSDPTAHATYTLSLHDALPISVAATFLEFWADHSALMAVIDLVALQGDPRFRDVRTEVVSPFTLAAAEVIRAQQDAGNVPKDINPIATAVVLVSMLSHVAAHQERIQHAGVREPDVLRAMSRMIFTGVTGQPPPD